MCCVLLSYKIARYLDKVKPHFAEGFEGLRAEEKDEFRYKNYKTQYNSTNRGQKYGTGRDVFCVFRIRMVFGGSKINVEFDSGVETFGCDYHGDGENQEEPFSCRDVKIKSEINYDDPNDKMKT